MCLTVLSRLLSFLPVSDGRNRLFSGKSDDQTVARKACLQELRIKIKKLHGELRHFKKIMPFF